MQYLREPSKEGSLFLCDVETGRAPSLQGVIRYNTDGPLRWLRTRRW